MTGNRLLTSDLPSNFPEQLEFYAQHLTAPQRRIVFEEIYRGHKKPRYVSDLSSKTKLSAIRVAQEAAKLASIGLVAKGRAKNPTTGESETYYEKLPEISVHLGPLLKLAKNKKVRDKLVTKRRPKVFVAVRISSRKISSAARSRREKLKVLYLTATPSSQDPLRTDAESRMVQDEIRGSRF